ncbi:glycosyltransferase [Pseudorhodoplanes sinuspersici]|nr:glycosyltransferase [Pseudorhodoplanes sinuspersici]RKE72320.1 glycosyltransferase involved in cell wall biosynthesis [Pseudorhodoplanes sinuspersici]
MTNRALKIFHIITDLDVGGAEMALMRLVSNPSSLPMQHQVISLKSGGKLEDEIRANGIPVTTIGLNGARDFGNAFVQLARLFRTKRPDLIVTWLYHADFLGTLANLSTVRAPLIWNIRCADMDLSKYSALTRTLPRILAKLSRCATVIVTNSNAGRRAHEAYGYRARYWQTIPNGFDLLKFHPDSRARMNMREELKVAPESLLVGLIARVDPMKGHETFLAAAAKIASTVPSARFLLAGRGTDSAGFRNAIAAKGVPADKIILLGERLDMPAILSALDLSVSSSRTEGFSNTVAEAMAVGIPCVVTDVGDSAIIVGDTGRVVRKDSPDELAKAIIEILMLPQEERAALGAAARDRISRNYALETISQEYAKTFAGVIRGEFP